MAEMPTRVGDYVIEAELGAGGMATVYRARHAILDTLHAVKVLATNYRENPDARQRFLDEARIQAKHLDHPNIVKVTNVVATPEHAALVMELIDGPSLDERIATFKDRPEELRRIMVAILDAVEHAHSAGIIHRDLKPGNVLLANRGGRVEPMVTDFGIAKVTAAEGAATGKASTHADARMGTLQYMSPEQIRRAKDVTPRSDVFSLGAMLYEMATGVAPFAGDSDYDVMDSIVRGRFEPPVRRYTGIDPAIAAAITKALAPDPADRFASCAELAKALTGTAVHVAEAPAASERTPRGRSGVAAALVAGSIAIGGGAVYLLMRRGGDEPRPAGAGSASGAIAVASDAGASASPPPVDAALVAVVAAGAAADAVGAAKPDQTVDYPTQVIRGLRPYMTGLQRCFEDELKRNPAAYPAPIKVVIKLTVRADGTVSKADARGLGTRPDKCLSLTLATIELPRPPMGGVVDVSIPIRFVPPPITTPVTPARTQRPVITPPAPPPIAPPPPKPVLSGIDTDGDGVDDAVDRCPHMREDGSDGDGCPGVDADNDKIPNRSDKCPEVPEDWDSVDDFDGCPEP